MLVYRLFLVRLDLVIPCKEQLNLIAIRTLTMTNYFQL